MSTPVFAIVGHPNKGKSSIVSTLARDESVAISPLPGTTVANREYPMIIDGEMLYLLIDTPGFQRARAALEWLQAHAGSAVDRADTVRRFVEQYRDDARFAAECRRAQSQQYSHVGINSAVNFVAAYVHIVIEQGLHLRQLRERIPVTTV